jgi:DNA gyrase subunit A
MARRKKITEEKEIIEKPIVDRDIVTELHDDFHEYSDEVNLSRQMNYISNGQKPVQSRVAWAMYYNGHFHNKAYTKSATVEGEVMRFHPHAGAYGVMARMAQDFVYPVPLLDGHGGYGSLIGGPEVSNQRYTEIRMAEVLEDALFYNTNILHMGKNYSEECPEPILQDWVAKLPLLFMTNELGMGYGIKATWSSSNLFEIRDQILNFIKTGKVDCTKVFPDFPTGGIIINKSELASIYETGKGTIRLRGETEIEGDTIKIYSLPYGYFPKDYREKVKKLVETTDNVPIVDMADRCDRNGFLIEIMCQEGTAEYVRELLYRKTPLQINITDLHIAIGESGQPETITLPKYIEYFVRKNLEIIVKEAQYDLDKVNHRLEVLYGLLSALDVIDEIIKTIKSSKSSEDAKQAIVKKAFKGKNGKALHFTEVQAEAIVTTQLGKLANLEKQKLNDEKDSLEKQKAEDEKLINDEKARTKLFVKQFNALVDKYGWERKTQLEDIEMQDIRVAVTKPKVAKPKKIFKVVLTEAQTLKRVDPTKFRSTDEDSKFITVEGNQYVTMVTNLGNMYKIKSNTIDVVMPAASGNNISDLRPEIGKNEKVIAIYSEDVDLPYIYFVTKTGVGKKMPVDNCLKISKAIGTTVCGLKVAGDEVIAVKLLKEDENIEITTNQRTVTIDAVGQNVQAGRSASGKVVLKLKKGEQITEVHGK